MAKKTTKTPNYDSLDPRGQRFVDEYCKTGNKYQSAKKAGYSEATAIKAKNDLLENPITGKPRKIGLAVRERVKDYEILSKDESQKIVEETYLDAIENGEKMDIRLSGAEKLAKLKGLTNDNTTLILNQNSSVVEGILKDIYEVHTPNTEG